MSELDIKNRTIKILKISLLISILITIVFLTLWLIEIHSSSSSSSEARSSINSQNVSNDNMDYQYLSINFPGIIHKAMDNPKKEISETDLDKIMEYVVKVVECEKIQTKRRIASTDIEKLTEKYMSDIYFINLTRSKERNTLIRKEINRMDTNFSNVYHFHAISHKQPYVGCYTSQLCVLIYAYMRTKTHAYIHEDDFQYARDYKEVMQYIKMVDDYFKGKDKDWDVIMMGQFVHKMKHLHTDGSKKLFRMVEHTTASGYIVNRKYMRKMIRYYLTYADTMYSHPVFQTEDHYDQIWKPLIKTDMWVGFEKAMGWQQPMVSDTGGGMADNRWIPNKDLKSFTYNGQQFPLTVEW